MGSSEEYSTLWRNEPSPDGQPFSTCLFGPYNGQGGGGPVSPIGPPSPRSSFPPTESFEVSGTPSTTPSTSTDVVPPSIAPPLSGLQDTYESPEHLVGFELESVGGPSGRNGLNPAVIVGRDTLCAFEQWSPRELVDDFVDDDEVTADLSAAMRGDQPQQQVDAVCDVPQEVPPAVSTGPELSVLDPRAAAVMPTAVPVAQAGVAKGLCDQRDTRFDGARFFNVRIGGTSHMDGPRKAMQKLYLELFPDPGFVAIKELVDPDMFNKYSVAAMLHMFVCICEKMGYIEYVENVTISGRYEPYTNRHLTTREGSRRGFRVKGDFHVIFTHTLLYVLGVEVWDPASFASGGSLKVKDVGQQGKGTALRNLRDKHTAAFITAKIPDRIEDYLRGKKEWVLVVGSKRR